MTWALPLALLVQGVLAHSPLLRLAGIRGTHLAAAVGALVAFEVLVRRRAVPRRVLLMCAGVVVGSGLTALHWHTPRIALLPAFFVGAALLAGLADARDTHRFLSMATGLLSLLLVLAWVGFLYAQLGGPSLLRLTNADLRTTDLYLTTLSNYRVLDSIRPAGIFDEPGTLSMLVCLLVALRSAHGRRLSTSIALLLGALVTFNLAHFVFVALFLLLQPRGHLVSRLALLASLAAGAAVALTFLGSTTDALLSWRLRYDSLTGTLGGDNRTAQVVQALSLLTPRAVLWGLDPSGLTAPRVFEARFGNLDETPLGPLITSGILVSFPYYLVLGWLVLRGLRDRGRRDLLAAVALFLPRPYVTSYGYAVLAILLLLSVDRPFRLPGGRAEWPSWLPGRPPADGRPAWSRLALAGGVFLVALGATRGRPALWSSLRELDRTPEERRLLAHGSCDGWGYGHVRRVAEAMPDPASAPRVRYRDVTRPVEVLLPGRLRTVGDEVLVGVALEPSAFLEQTLPAVPWPPDGSPAPPRRFLLETRDEFDRLVGFRVHVRPGSEGRAALLLRESVRRPRVLATGILTVPPGTEAPLRVDLPAPIDRFSLGRPRTPFVVEVRPEAGRPLPAIAALSALAVKVVTDGYVRLASDERGCFTALRADRLEAAERSAHDPWRAFVDRMRQPGRGAGKPGAPPGPAP